MDKDDVFSTVELTDGKICEILDIKFGHISAAMFAQQVEASNPIQIIKYDIFMHLYERILLIDGKAPTRDDLINMSIDDYLKISEVVNAAVSILKL